MSATDRLPTAATASAESKLQDPYCFGLQEIPEASQLRHQASGDPALFENADLFTHLARGLAYTVGSALGSTPPSIETCLEAYLVSNSQGLTAGSRAWSKHSHRSQPQPSDEEEKDKRRRSEGWWGVTRGPVAVINEKSLTIFHKVMDTATWRNLHWLPHQVLVYEVRVAEGYGMRWSQNQAEGEPQPWIFRGFLEPTMENGHELKWRHPV
ncbi:hypothetical protein D9619_013579 [Psilocybe cf. subviscida]|uniref:Uncharacterized protein n=1 Tax=Psilocybe cf. subviscida TaxID=2480587 RepID=A0A8H5AQG3_9AGAR|nr:hypothetical protein D9619_013579 [Psilocybe cf. subviscida]